MPEAPHEVLLMGVYAPPFLVVCALGLLTTVALSQVMNLAGVSRLFWHPPLAFVAMWVLASSLIGLVLIAP